MTMANDPPIHVVKIGGSLLDLVDLPARLRRWRAGRAEVHDVYVVGGGPVVDGLRARTIDPDAAHWAAIELMGANAGLLATTLGEWPICTFGPVLRERTTRPGATLLDVPHFMRHVEPIAEGTKLPVGWETTSDAIAGRLAVVLGADELVLLKSTLPENAALDELAAVGLVDSVLPTLAGVLPALTVWDFRSETWQSVVVPNGDSPGR
jgi:aspartokinase-like uncharacterized kinase